METKPHSDILLRLLDVFFSIFTEIWNTVKITGLFVIFSIPIVTVFASFGAAVYCLVKLNQGDGTRILQNFLSFFKEEFWRSSIVGLLCLMTMYACVISGTYYYIVALESGFQYIPILLFTSLFLFTFLFWTAYYTVRSSVDVPFFSCIKNAACLICLSAAVDIGMVLVLIMLLILVYLKQSLLILLPLIWIMYTRLSVFCYGKQIHKYMIQEKQGA